MTGFSRQKTAEKTMTNSNTKRQADETDVSMHGKGVFLKNFFKKTMEESRENTLTFLFIFLVSHLSPSDSWKPV